MWTKALFTTALQQIIGGQQGFPRTPEERDQLVGLLTDKPDDGRIPSMILYLQELSYIEHTNFGMPGKRKVIGSVVLPPTKQVASVKDGAHNPGHENDYSLLQEVLDLLELRMQENQDQDLPLCWACLMNISDGIALAAVAGAGLSHRKMMEHHANLGAAHQGAAETYRLRANEQIRADPVQHLLHAEPMGSS